MQKVKCIIYIHLKSCQFFLELIISVDVSVIIIAIICNIIINLFQFGLKIGTSEKTL